LGEEDVVDVVAAIFVMPEIVGGLSFFALGFGEEIMVGGWGGEVRETVIRQVGRSEDEDED
jgi:hypothetical protein